MIRKAICAGSWYPAEKKDIEEYLDLKAPKTGALACVSPHAGWMYSGKVAGAVFSRLENYDTYIIIGPNHTGLGPQASVYPSGGWQMPLGEVGIDTDLAASILKMSEFLEPDVLAHSREHSIEVQLPFIQYYNPDALIVPILLMTDRFEVCSDLGNAVYQSVKASGRKVLVVASSDMTHYENQRYASKQDHLAIGKILDLDAKGLMDIVLDRGISMCGVAPTASAIIAAKKAGAEKSELVKYATSGDVTGDFDAVVGYAGMILS